VLQASPVSLAFLALGPANAKRFVISTSAASLTATVADPSVASVATFTDVKAPPATKTFVVTPLAAGATNISVIDGSGSTIAVVPVTVMTAATAAPPIAPPAATTASGGGGGGGYLYGIAAIFVAGIALLARGNGGIYVPAVTPAPTPSPTPSPVLTPSPTPSPTSPPAASRLRPRLRVP